MSTHYRTYRLGYGRKRVGLYAPSVPRLDTIEPPVTEPVARSRVGQALDRAFAEIESAFEGSNA
jgi:hypothetical protein